MKPFQHVSKSPGVRATRLPRSLKHLALTAVLAVAGATSARADAIEDFYKGRTVSLVVSSSTGGGYDALARMLSKYSRETYSRPAQYRGAQHAGRGRHRRHQSSLLGRGARRIRHRRRAEQHALRAAFRHQGGDLRSDEIQLARLAQRRDERLDRLAHVSGRHSRPGEKDRTQKWAPRDRIRRRASTAGF